MEDLIFIDNLPMYERYEFIDANEDIWKKLKENSNMDMRGIDKLFIKGINREEREENTILWEDFFKEYLKLGKKLFELVYKKHRIRLIHSYQVDEILDLKERYVGQNYLDITENLQSDEISFIGSTLESLDKLEIISNKSHIDRNVITKITKLGREILCDLLILHNLKNLDIFPYLYKLSDTLFSEVELINMEFKSILKDQLFSDSPLNYNELNKIQKMCLEDLTSFIEELRKILPNDEIQNIIQKELSNNKVKKLNNIKNSHFYNYNKSSLITVLFSYNHLKDIKRIILPFLKRFGFPYFVSNYEEKEYHQISSSLVSLNDNEEIIPCNLLIENSIFNYMYYSLFSNWEATDERILEVFHFISKDEFRDSKELKDSTYFRTNRKNIINDKTNLFYYYNVICSDIFGFESGFFEIEKEQNTNNNHFRSVKDKIYTEKIFSNLCIAMNMLIQEQTDYFTVQTKYKKCLSCGKKFVPSAKLKKYCSKKCSIQGRKNNDKERKKLKL